MIDVYSEILQRKFEAKVMSAMIKDPKTYAHMKAQPTASALPIVKRVIKRHRGRPLSIMDCTP